LLGIVVPPQKQSGKRHFELVHFVADDINTGVGYKGSGLDGGTDEPFLTRDCFRLIDCLAVVEVVGVVVGLSVVILGSFIVK
jgi:hypothetical protein